jgi:hypothetical protein
MFLLEGGAKAGGRSLNLFVGGCFPSRYVIISVALKHPLCNKYSLYIFYINVNYVIVILSAHSLLRLCVKCLCDG